MTIERTLAEMRDLMRRRSDLVEKLERAECSATSTGGIGDGMPRPTDTAPKVERYGIYIAELRDRIERIDKQLDLYAQDLSPAIARITDPRDAQALRLRYIEHKPASKIAHEMSYNRTAMLRIIRNAETLWLK